MEPINNTNGKAATTKRSFSRETMVSIQIQADAAIVWALLTKAADYPRWNSTVTSLEGTIALGEKIQLRSILDPKRVFKLKVKGWEPEKKLVWGDGMGNRLYTLTQNQQGTLFTMHEKIGGPLFPLFAKMIPPFDAVFEQFAGDLKKEAESIMQTR
jgi:uncharacterized protein YndB with AHSA1/START domain